MEISDISANDVRPHVELMLAVSGHPRNETYWQWMNTGYDETLITGLKHKGEILASYAVHARDLVYQGQIYRVGFATQALMHTDYRDLKNLVRLTDEVWRRCRLANINYVIGFPNNNIWMINKRVMDWSEIAVFPSYEVTLEKIKSSIKHPPVDHISADIPNELYFETQSGVCLKKDYDWFRWRFNDNPCNYYRIRFVESYKGHSYLIAKTYNSDNGIKFGHFIDFQFSDYDSFAALVFDAVSYFEWSGVDRISLWLMPSSDYLKWFVSLGFSDSGFSTNFGIKDVSNNRGGSPLYDFNKWNIHMSFSDAF